MKKVEERERAGAGCNKLRSEMLGEREKEERGGEEAQELGQLSISCCSASIASSMDTKLGSQDDDEEI